MNLNFDEGYKELTINNDPARVIRFNPTDPALVERFRIASGKFDEIAKEAKGYKNESIEESAEMISRLDDEIKKQIDYIFNSPVSDVVFGNQSPRSPLNGVPLYERFLLTAMPYIKECVTKERKAAQKRINKYVDAAKKV